MTFRNPFRRRLFVTLHFKSGASHTLRCGKFTTRRGLDNSLSEISTDGKLPLYVRLDTIEFITSRRGWAA